MRLEQLAKLPKAQRESAVEELARKASAPRNGQATGIDARLREFEIRYEMSSADMRARFARGELADTADIASWLMLLRVRER